jgi:alkylated DNA repair dioxygenase AlkB
MPAIKFARPDELPEGFLYRNDFLSEPEESGLLEIFERLDFSAYDYHGYQAKRRVVRFGVNYDINTSELTDAQPIPEYLLGIRARAAEFAGLSRAGSSTRSPSGAGVTAPELSANDLVQAMISEYSPGTPIGWHRDAPQFGIIIGISLASACRMRLKPYSSNGESRGKVLSLRLEPRSIYVMKGEARSAWQHSIPAVDQLRYSITFRTLRSKRTVKAA